jgi:hypothetical protein
MTTAIRVASAGTLLVVLGLLPAAADAQHRGQGHGHGHHRFHHRPLGSRLVVVAPLFPFGYYAASSVYSAPPVYYAPPPVAYPAPPAYGPAPAYAAPPAPAYAPPLRQDVEPIQREVVFPTGRYVLRGDGVSTPYTWVWIPNPPTAPPGTPSGSRETERAIYAWTDGNGVTTWTDRLAKVPPEHRANAQRTP